MTPASPPGIAAPFQPLLEDGISSAPSGRCRDGYSSASDNLLPEWLQTSNKMIAPFRAVVGDSYQHGRPLPISAVAAKAWASSAQPQQRL